VRSTAKRPEAGSASIDNHYWVFVCNPKKWAIDRFLKTERQIDTWGVRPSDRGRFSPGQLAVVRVGVDRRSAAERHNGERLTPGIYALCEVQSKAFPATGAGDEFWAPKARRAPGWPTVIVRYVRTYQDHPLTIDTLRQAAPKISPLLIKGFEAASFPISSDDFRAVLALLGEDLEDLPVRALPIGYTDLELAKLEGKYLDATPEIKERISRTIERGAVAAQVKRLNNFECQVCKSLGLAAIGFKKTNGEPYVESHHVMPVSMRQVGSLAASNIITVCANHHRELHYGRVQIKILERTFLLVFPNRKIEIPRLGFEHGSVLKPRKASLERALSGT
jgi:predicted RNA-binding protein with PUA-like domain